MLNSKNRLLLIGHRFSQIDTDFLLDNFNGDTDLHRLTQIVSIVIFLIIVFYL